jgi:hypothetical protein
MGAMANEIQDDAPSMTDETTDDAETAAPKRRSRAPRGSAARRSEKESDSGDKPSVTEKAPQGKAKAAAAGKVPAGFTRVKAGSHSVWVTRELAKALSAKDRKKLKALLKKAAKRKKSA